MTCGQASSPAPFGVDGNDPIHPDDYGPIEHGDIETPDEDANGGMNAPPPDQPQGGHNNLSTTSSSVDATSCKLASSTNHTLIIQTKPLSQMQPVADEESSSEEQPLAEPSRCRRNRDMFPMMGKAAKG